MSARRALFFVAALALTGTAACGGARMPQSVGSPQPFDGGGARDPAKRLAHGMRLAHLLGCHSCHGEMLQGTNSTADDPAFGDMNAPNLSLLLPRYTDTALDRAIRGGVPRDGRTMWFMASEAFRSLSDDDLAALIAHLRTFAPGGKPMPPLRFGPGFRRAQQTGEMKPAAVLVARFARERPIDLGVEHRRGRFLAQVTCAECHNARLDGYAEFTPDLDIVANYSSAEFDRLIVTGKGRDARDLGLMANTARGRLHLLTPGERRALFGYLRARANHDLGS